MPLFASSDRDELRRAWLDAWRKHQAGAPVEPLEAQLIDVMLQHPEYRATLTAGDEALVADWTPETGQSNPFLHMGLHLAVREALGTDRPAGIRKIYQQLLERGMAEHDAQHVLLESLGETLWEAQRSGRPPDGSTWLARLQRG